MSIKIDKNVPVPSGKRGPAAYPWDDMQPGDSFFVPGKTPKTLGGAVVTPKNRGMKIRTRSVTENGVAGVRIWRVDGLGE